MTLNEEIRQAKIASVRAAIPKAVTAEQLAALNRMLEDLDADGESGPSAAKPERKIAKSKIGRPRKYDIGTTFGQLTITARSGRYITAECTCGETIELTITALTQGGKRDCGKH